MLTRAPLLGAAAVAIGVVVLAGLALLVSNPAEAAPPPAVTFRDANAVRDAGLQIGLPRRQVGGATLIEPRTATAAPVPATAVSADGSVAALSPVDAGQIGPLVLARADGSQLEVALPGVAGGAFAPGGAWLAVVDAAGALWRVDAASGAAVRLADGPFAADPSVPDDGRVLAVRLSSVEAPFWAAAEIIDATSGTSVPVDPTTESEDQLVYGASALVDGSIALVRHRVGGGVAVVRLASDQPPELMANLGATSVAVSPAGDWLAWSEGDDLRLAPARSLDKPTDLGPGATVRFAPDGSLVLVIGAQSASVVDLHGEVMGEASTAACWTGTGRGCRP